MTINSEGQGSTEKNPLFLQKRFLPMWSGFVLGAFADNMLRQALIIGIGFGVISLPWFSNSDSAIPIVGSFFAIAMLLFSSISGQIADKYETAFLFRRIKLIEVILMGIAGIGFLLNSGLLLVLTLFAMGAQSAFFSPVRIGAMPKYLRAEELVKGNAYCNAGLFVAILLGLFLGGVLIEWPNGAILLSGALLSASFIGWLFIRRAPVASADAPSLELNFNIPMQTWRIMSYAFQAPGVARPLLGAAAFYFVSTFVTVITPIYTKEVWGAGGGVANAIMGLFAIGAGLGAMSAAFLSGKRSGLGVAAGGISAAALLIFVIYLLGLNAPGLQSDSPLRSPAEFFALPGVAILCLSFTLSSAALGLFMVPMQAAAQRRAPPERRARIMAAGNMLNAAAAMAGSLSVLFVTNTSLTPDASFVGLALFLAAIGGYMIIRWRRTARDLYDAEFLQEQSSAE